MWFVLLLLYVFGLLLWLATSSRKKRFFPSPTGAVPVLGHALAFADMKQLHHQFSKWSKEMGHKNYQITLMGQQVVVWDNFEDACTIWKVFLFLARPFCFVLFVCCFFFLLVLIFP
jgi:hypothetical protein